MKLFKIIKKKINDLIKLKKTFLNIIVKLSTEGKN